MKTKILIMLCIVVLAACKKKETANEPKVEQKTYVKKQIFASGENTWNYDAENQLRTITFVSKNEAASPSFTFTFIYDANHRITERHADVTNPSSDDYVYKNTYDANGKVTLETYANKTTGAFISSKNFTYTANTVTISKKDASGTVTGSEVYTYSNDGKNVIKLEIFGPTGTLFSTQVFGGFDDKKSFLQLYPIGYTTPIMHANNHTIQNFTNNISGSAINATVTYEYNMDGYITKRTINSNSAESFEYIKK
ncbi:RHS repeat protein [Pedobacter sp. Hv1]|uniref:RHS repeat protein n=1 Tax=Pedobacter sp. Hv1 TaxID=1740090 RepID=UPI0006D8D601|nr:RHS repeat protein [Pedobacter sp. Hv1]KQC00832.1 hypothetical protein AQF98_09135 [Pedobacter sp. Hv1]